MWNVGAMNETKHNQPIFERSPHDRQSDRRSANSALDRALMIIETLLDSDQPLGLNEISARLELPRQSAHRIINNLIKTGLVQRHFKSDRIALGPRMRRLALETMWDSHRSWPSHAILEDLAEQTGETCNLGVLEGNKVLLVDRVETHLALRIHSEVGTRLDFHTSAIGKMIVSHLPKERRHRLITSRPLKRFTPFSKTTEPELEEEFSEIRRRGYSIANQGTMLGIFGIAMPIHDPKGRILAGLACQAPLMRMDIEEGEKVFLPALKDATQRLQELIAEDFANIP
jgi:IclR family transcriptional regulator, acetate operon repressor